MTRHTVWGVMLAFAGAFMLLAFVSLIVIGDGIEFWVLLLIGNGFVVGGNIIGSLEMRS